MKLFVLIVQSRVSYLFEMTIPPYLGGVGLGCVISLVADLAQPYKVGLSE
jgi:hypothetical protein